MRVRRRQLESSSTRLNRAGPPVGVGRLGEVGPLWTVGVQNGTGFETTRVCWAEHHVPSRRKVSAVRGIAYESGRRRGSQIGPLLIKGLRKNLRVRAALPPNITQMTSDRFRDPGESVGDPGQSIVSVLGQVPPERRG